MDDLTPAEIKHGIEDATDYILGRRWEAAAVDSEFRKVAALASMFAMECFM